MLSLDNVFHQLSRLNFNQVYISVYNNGVTYPSKISDRNREKISPSSTLILTRPFLTLPDKVGWAMPTLFREIVLPFQPAKHRP